MLELFWHP